MADTTKKIYFEVDDKNVESTFNRYKQLANESARAMIGSANQYAQTGREVNKYLEDEIRLREKKAKIEFDERRTDVTERYRKEIHAAKTDFDRDKIERGYQGRMQEVAMDEKEFQKQTNLLKSIYDQLVSNAREEIREDRQNVEKQVQAYRSGKLKDLSVEEEAKVKIQSDMIGGEGGQKKQGMFSPVFFGSLLGNLIPQIINKIGGVVSADSTERAFNSLISSIPFVGDVAAATRERMLQEKQDFNINRLRYSAIGGTGVAARFSGVGYGFRSSEIYDLAGETARSRGMAGGNIQSSLDIAALKQAYGLDIGQLMSISKSERFGGGGTMENVGLVITTLKNQGLWDQNSQVKIPEYLAMMVSLQEEQIRVTGKVDNSQNLANISAMAKLGDKYFRDTSYVTGISSAIANPQNEFQKARSLAVLANMNPNADLWELEMMQEKGLSQKGYMSGIIGQISERYGKGNMGEKALFETLRAGGQNISRQDAKTIYQQSLKDPSMWDNVMDEESLQKTISKFAGTTRYLGKQRTDTLTKDIVQTSEAFVDGALPGAMNLIDNTFKKIGKGLEDAADKIGKNLGIGAEAMDKIEKSVKAVWYMSPFVVNPFRAMNKNEVVGE